MDSIYLKKDWLNLIRRSSKETNTIAIKYRSKLRKPVSIKEIKRQKVRRSKFMFKMSTIHTNTCAQTTAPPRHVQRNRCRDDGVVQQPPNNSGDVLSTPSRHGSANGKPSLEGH